MQMEILTELIRSLSVLDYSVLAINFLLIIFAKPVLKRFSSGTLPAKTFNFRVLLLRGLNVIIVLVYAYQYVYIPAEDSSYGIKALGILAILYVAYLSNYLAQYYIHKYYGRLREIGDTKLYIETYQSRLFSIIAAIVVTLIAFISIIHQLDFDSLLEAGGVIGVLGVMLGLTQASWAPDIISGLIILNSDMFEEGDIVEMGDGVLGRVYKTKLFHTEILNISNNHRVMIRNAHVRDRVIHNLSKFASAKGLRECLSFKIGYDTPIEQIRKMFNQAFEDACAQGVPLEAQIPPEVKVLETGDHAVCWAILFYVKRVDQLVSIRRDFRELILIASEKMGVSLATPLTHYQVQDPKPGM